MGGNLAIFKNPNCTMSCCNGPGLSEPQNVFRNQLKIAGCSISIIFTVYVIIMAVLFKVYENVKELLILNVLISGFLVGFFYLVNKSTNNVVSCNILGFTMTYVDTIIILWVISITIYMFIDAYNLWFDKNVAQENDWRVKYKRVYLIVGWLFPLIPCVIPLFELDYKPSGDWCWMFSFPYRYSLYYGPWFIISVFLFAITICTIIFAQRANSRESQNRPNTNSDKRKIMSLLGYPIIFMVFSIPSACNRVYELNSPGCTNYILSCIQAFVAPLKGAAYSCLFIRIYRKQLFNRGLLRNACLNWKSHLNHSDGPYTLDDIKLEERPTTICESETIDQDKCDLGQDNFSYSNSVHE